MSYVNFVVEAINESKRELLIKDAAENIIWIAKKAIHRKSQVKKTGDKGLLIMTKSGALERFML